MRKVDVLERTMTRDLLFYQTEMDDLTGTLRRAIHEIAQERELRKIAEEKLELLQGKQDAMVLTMQELTETIHKMQDSNVAGDEAVARSLQDTWNRTGPPPGLSAPAHPPKPPGTNAYNPTQQIPGLSMGGADHMGGNQIPYTRNPFEVLNQTGSYADAVQSGAGGWSNPSGYPPAPARRTTAAAPQIDLRRSEEEAELKRQDALKLSLRLTGYELDSTPDAAEPEAQVVSFLSSTMHIAPSSMHIESVSTVTVRPRGDDSTAQPPPIVIVCRDIDTRNALMRNKMALKGEGTPKWLDSCLTPWQLGQRKGKLTKCKSLREGGSKAFFEGHRLMTINNGRKEEVLNFE